VTVERIGGCFLLRSADERAEDQIELIGDLMPPPEYAVVVAAVSDDLAAAMWPRLGEVLAQVRSESRQVVLALSDAGRGSTDEAALARRIADAWKLTVVAPAGDVLLMPGGMLFAHVADGDAQWWSFAPDSEPTPLGPRWPAPTWSTGGSAAVGVRAASPGEPASTDVAAPQGGPVPTGAAAPPGRSTLTAVPAGLLVQRAGTPPPVPGDLAYAVPAVHDRPSILVDAGVTATGLVTALSSLTARPEWRRHPLHLVPVGARDLLPLGQAVARDLEVDVEVLTGPPVNVAEAHHDAGPSVVLLDEAGHVAWTPFVSSVLCRRPDPGGAETPPPHPVTWRPPMAGMRVVDDARGVLWLGENWRVAVTRAGLWAYPADADPEIFPDRVTAAWPVTAGSVRVDVGAPDRKVDDQVWPQLADLLIALPGGPHARLHVVVHGAVTAEGEAAVRRLTSRHDADVELGKASPVDEPPPQVRTSLTPPTPVPPSAPPRSSGPPAPPSPPERTVSPPDGPPEPPTTSAPPVPPGPVASSPVVSSTPVGPARTSTSGQDVPVISATASGPVAGPGRRSTEAEREAFRAMVGRDWEAHAAPLRRTFSRLPAIGADERAAATVDFVAVRLYLMRPDDPFGPAAARSGGESLRPYLACLASGLDRLPTYRGAVVCGADAPVPVESIGTVLTEPGPLGGVPLTATHAPSRPRTSTVQVIWSDTARRVAALFDAESEEETRQGDVVFAPGSRFAVLDVRSGDADTPDLVLLRELPPTAEHTPPDGRLALSKLEEALKSVHPHTETAPSPLPAHFR
jgi:hypothetical protein